jgi:hypothetical protein
MSPVKSYARLFLAIACIVVSLAAMINVFGDNDEVLAKAKDTACPPHVSGSNGMRVACDLARMDRSPFAQTFDFRSTPGPVTVRCTRGAIFFGDYGCEKK